MDQKIKPFRSKKLLEIVRDIPKCSGCDKWNDGTIVAAHSNDLLFGKGRGIKTPDNYIAALCFECHSNLDQGDTMDKEGKFYFWLRAHIKTVNWLFVEEHLKVK